METYSAEHIWAASWAAFKQNGYEYIREGYITNNGEKEINKNILALYVRDPKTLSEDDLEMGRRMREYYSRLTFTALERELNDFEKMVAGFVIEEFFSYKEFAIMASIAGKFYRDQERIKKNEAMAKLRDGKHLGEPGVHIRLDHVRVINSNISHKYLRYFNLGEHNGSLVCWWSDATPCANEFTITAKVKDHTSWDSDGISVPLTKLNYVKATPYYKQGN